ncbi:hypothetical protein [Pseudomonas viridiflava]|uniref:hypothetical protein n=1 Tax=Pseudomonas viridiflava TaxID=33069 RepID=UPI0013C2EA0D|nr:hypothetical protein [Pseudomonas viridiflava]
MSELPGGTGFGQTLEVFVGPLSVWALAKALTEQTEQFISQHPGFVGASVQVSEYQHTVHLHLYWHSKEASENALAYPKQGEGDLVQLVNNFQVRTMKFQTFFVCADIRAQH